MDDDFELAEMPKFDMTDVRVLSVEMTPNSMIFARIVYSDGTPRFFSVIGWVLWERGGKTTLSAYIIFGGRPGPVIADTIVGFDGLYNGVDVPDDDEEEASYGDIPFDGKKSDQPDLFGRDFVKLTSAHAWLN